MKAPVPNERKMLSLWPGVGLVAANMIGAGVFLSTGFMAQELGPGTILFAWLVGAVLALAGARAYATVAQLVPRSGGEYRYLSELLHPALGYLAGWASLLVGFSAPVAVDALAAGSFANVLAPSLDVRWVGGLLILVLTLLHVLGMRTSARTQNALAVLKACLVIGFAVVGVASGNHAWPTWQPPTVHPGFPLRAVANNLFFITFAFSGWNAATYAAEEFERPARDVPRAMLIGCGLVAVLYLVVNWVFVANITPAQATAVFAYETKRVTLGHLIAHELVGDVGARIMSGVIIALFISAISSMTFVGPRVYAAMAKDGFLPRVFAGSEGKPPVASVLLQSSLALLIVLTHSLQQALSNVGAILQLFAAMTVFSLFRVRWGRPDLARPPVPSLIAAGLYAALTAWMLYLSFGGELACYVRMAEPSACAAQPHTLLWIAVVAMVALVAYGTTRVLRRPAPVKNG
jgi:APA family basic amino acid/polyamine antiporter